MRRFYIYIYIYSPFDQIVQVGMITSHRSISHLITMLSSHMTLDRQLTQHVLI